MSTLNGHEFYSSGREAEFNVEVIDNSNDGSYIISNEEKNDNGSTEDNGREDDACNKCTNTGHISNDESSERQITPYATRNHPFHTVISNDLLYEVPQGFLNFNGLNNLLDVNRSFNALKKTKFYWKLNNEYSSKYYYDDNFKSTLDTLLTNRRTQLSLILSKRYRSAFRFLLRDVIDVNNLGNVHELDLSGCKNITDVRCLGMVYKLDLSGCTKITNVSNLGNVHILNLSGCEGISDVNALVNVHELDLSYCHSIVDVRALGHVYKLDLSACYKIVDVGALGNLHTLNLGDSIYTHCRGITDFSALNNVSVLIQWKEGSSFFRGLNDLKKSRLLSL